MDYYKIGQRIRKYRKACDLSQEVLAEYVNISTTHMSHIETGSTKLSLPVLVAIADKLGVRTDDLLTDADYPTKNAAVSDIYDVLDQCTPKAAKVLAAIVHAVKPILDSEL